MAQANKQWGKQSRRQRMQLPRRTIEASYGREFSSRRRAALKTCPRSVAYDTFKKYQGWLSTSTLETRANYALSKATPIEAMIGIICHDLITEVLAAYQRSAGVRHPLEEEVVAAFHARRKALWIASRDWDVADFLKKPRGTIPDRPEFRVSPLAEKPLQRVKLMCHLYPEPEDDAAKRQLTLGRPQYVHKSNANLGKKGEAALRRFFKHMLPAIKRYPVKDWQFIERQSDDMPGFDLDVDGTKIRVHSVIDFATWRLTDESRTLVIIDWKTGKKRVVSAEEYLEQVILYALYALDAWSLSAPRPLSGALFQNQPFSAEDIELNIVYLGQETTRASEMVHKLLLTTPMLEAARNDLIADIRRGRTMFKDPDQGIGNIEDFPVTTTPSKDCPECRFMGICPDAHPSCEARKPVELRGFLAGKKPKKKSG